MTIYSQWDLIFSDDYFRDDHLILVILLHCVRSWPEACLRDRRLLNFSLLSRTGYLPFLAWPGLANTNTCINDGLANTNTRINDSENTISSIDSITHIL